MTTDFKSVQNYIHAIEKKLVREYGSIVELFYGGKHGNTGQALWKT